MNQEMGIRISGMNTSNFFIKVALVLGKVSPRDQSRQYTNVQYNPIDQDCSRHYWLVPEVEVEHADTKVPRRF